MQEETDPNNHGTEVKYRCSRCGKLIDYDHLMQGQRTRSLRRKPGPSDKKNTVETRASTVMCRCPSCHKVCLMTSWNSCGEPRVKAHKNGSVDESITEKSEKNSKSTHNPERSIVQADPSNEAESKGGISIRYRCSLCPKTFIHMSSWYRHRKQYHVDSDDETSPPSPIVSLTSPEARATGSEPVRDNESSRSAEQFSCQSCVKSFSSGKLRREHMLRKHLDVVESQKTFQCNYCETWFISRQSWCNHETNRHRKKLANDSGGSKASSRCASPLRHKKIVVQPPVKAVLIPKKGNKRARYIECEFCSYVVKSMTALRTHIKDAHHAPASALPQALSTSKPLLTRKKSEEETKTSGDTKKRGMCRPECRKMPTVCYENEQGRYCQELVVKDLDKPTKEHVDHSYDVLLNESEVEFSNTVEAGNSDTEPPETLGPSVETWKGRGPIVCQYCSHRFTTRQGRLQHIRRKHLTALEAIQYKLDAQRPRAIQCTLCKKHFRSQQTLQTHMRKTHSINSNRALCVSCGICNVCVTTFVELREHLDIVHGITCKERRYLFPDRNSFLLWKKMEERDSKSEFTKKHGLRDRSNGKWEIFSCSRSNFQGKRNDASNQKGNRGKSKSEVGCCPAQIRLKTTIAGLEVSYYSTHVGHSEGPGLAKWTNEEETRMVMKLSLGVPIPVILQEAKRTLMDGVPTRWQQLTSNDLANLRRKYNLSLFHHVEDSVSIDILIRELGDSVVHYKQAGVETYETGVRKEDFLLAIMSSIQRSMLQKYGSNFVCADAVYETDEYKYLLLTLIVTDDHHHAFPVAYLIMTDWRTEVIEFLLSKIKSRVHFANQGTTLMYDISSESYYAWCRVFGPPKERLFNPWHFSKVCFASTQQISDEKQRKKIQAELHALINETDETTFLKNVATMQSYSLEGTSDVVQCVEYFFQNYGASARMWAQCNRPDVGNDVIANLEALHSELKQIFYTSPSVRRLDRAVANLLILTRTVYSELSNVYFPSFENFTVEAIRAEHLNSLGIPSNCIYPDTNKKGVYHVQSETNQFEFYEVVARKVSCAVCNASCTECGICIHAYTCQCIENAVKNIVCKHLHLISRYLTKLALGETAAVSALVASEEDEGVLSNFVMDHHSNAADDYKEAQQSVLSIAPTASAFLSIDDVRKTITNRFSKCIEDIEQCSDVNKLLAVSSAFKNIESLLGRPQDALQTVIEVARL